LARFIMWPCVTIMMGAMVGFVVYAIFSPGVAIIRNLAETVYP
jgi:type II secretory pathway component PulF